MTATKDIIVFFLATAWICTCSCSRNDCLDEWSASRINRTVRFSALSKKNQTGHWETKFSLDNTAQKLPYNWRADIQHSITKDALGMEVFHLKGKLIIPPPLPSGYHLYPGVGYYKQHLKDPLNFDEAYKACAEEGGHLAIINSEAEHSVIRSLVAPGSSTYLGFHDRVKEGEFITIFGDLFSSTGFKGWSAGQPDNYQEKEHCGSYYGGHGLNDVSCDVKRPFICEYDLSWAEC